jgi:hypothetical protein
MALEKSYYAVIDAEALVFGPPYVNIVEQLAIVFYDREGRERHAEHYIVHQPFTEAGLKDVYGIPGDVVSRAISGYYKVTGDHYIHSGGARWRDVRGRVTAECERFAAKVYAKGPQLENALFKGALHVEDLAPFGCPKYPRKIHNPLEECRFFSQWIPEIYPKK